MCFALCLFIVTQPVLTALLFYAFLVPSRNRTDRTRYPAGSTLHHLCAFLRHLDIALLVTSCMDGQYQADALGQGTAFYFLITVVHFAYPTTPIIAIA
jgi:hypothetical protein